MKIPAALTTRFARQILTLEKNSPQILFGVGIASTVTSTVMACRATLKLEEVLERTQGDLNLARSIDDEQYSEDDRQRDIRLIYTKSIVSLIRLYAPAIGFSLIGIASLTKSHQILNKRNVALAAAYSAVDKAFDRYRERVVEQYGEEKDQEFRYGTQQVEIIDPETNRKKKVTRVDSSEAPSMYAKFFDNYSSSWTKDGQSNLIFLRCQQNYMNELLRARGHLFLNEVYAALGLPHTNAGAVVGWMIGSGGDDCVDFGIFDSTKEVIRDFVHGLENSVLLDFNVDGVIYDKIPERESGFLAWQSN